MTDARGSGPRCAALVGPYLSGKTSLLESLLYRAGAISRRGHVRDKNTVGDSAPEARERGMSVELSVAHAEYLGDPWALIDCPGSIEFTQDGYNALMVADTAVVVVEPEPAKALAVAPLFRFLDEQSIPHMVFINKMDHANARVRDILDALQSFSSLPLVLRQVPIRDGDAVTGFVDLASERAYQYEPGKPSKLIELPQDMKDRELEARTEMLESLADFDDTLLEQLLEDVVPGTDEIFTHLTNNLQADRIVPVFLGSAENDAGIQRLWKALRHETPSVEATAARLGVDGVAEGAARVFKTYYLPHSGKLSVARLWSSKVKDGTVLNGERVSGVFQLMGGEQTKIEAVSAGEVAAFGRMDEIKTGDLLTPAGAAPNGAAAWPEPITPLYAFAIHAEKRDDEVKLSGALSRLIEEDPSLSVEQNPDTNQLLLHGQGEMHLRIALERLKNRYHMPVISERPQVPYKETIQRPVSQHARFKKQTGGHGQFGDVHVDIKPMTRGSGFEFNEKVVGGSVPRQFIPAVETGVKEYLRRGPLGFPVVDVSVTLTDGQHHSVDSSEQAFKTAGRMAMSEGLPKCNPVLLEPIHNVSIVIPSEFTSHVQRIVSGRRGQILGFDAKAGWKGWDEVTVQMPQSELHDLIIELRSLTKGVGFFQSSFDRLQELTGRLADNVVRAHKNGEDQAAAS
ncbi:MAG: elongation factor G [Alphaproteobacteria bacterium]|nr:elongation factor G [Alphaproteobacteria bacterium]